MTCVKFDANANPDGCCTWFDCRSKNSRLVAAKRRLKPTLHLVNAGQRCRFLTVADELRDPTRPGRAGGLRLVMGLEIVAKQGDSRYRSGRRREWIRGDHTDALRRRLGDALRMGARCLHHSGSMIRGYMPLMPMTMNSTAGFDGRKSGQLADPSVWAIGRG